MNRCASLIRGSPTWDRYDLARFPDSLSKGKWVREPWRGTIFITRKAFNNFSTVIIVKTQVIFVKSYKVRVRIMILSNLSFVTV